MKLRASRFQDSTAESLVPVVGIRSEKAGMTGYEPAALAGQNIRPSHQSEGRISPMRPLALPTTEADTINADLLEFLKKPSPSE